MLYTLTLSGQTVTLHPREDAQDLYQRLFVDHVTLGQKMARYDWGEIRRWLYNMDFVPTSDAQLLNQWWKNQSPLAWIMGTSSYTVKLDNETTPVGKIMIPYANQYQAQLNLVVI